VRDPSGLSRFGSIQDARAHGHVLFPWRNVEHVLYRKTMVDGLPVFTT